MDKGCHKDVLWSRVAIQCEAEGNIRRESGGGGGGKGGKGVSVILENCMLPVRGIGLSFTELVEKQSKLVDVVMISLLNHCSNKNMRDIKEQGSNPIEGNGHFFPSYRQLYLSSFSDTPRPTQRRSLQMLDVVVPQIGVGVFHA